MVGGLARLVRLLMMKWMSCLIVDLVCSANFSRSNVFSNQVFMSGCLQVERSCSGVGLGDRISRVLTDSPIQSLARNVALDLAWRV